METTIEGVVFIMADGYICADTFFSGRDEKAAFECRLAAEMQYGETVKKAGTVCNATLTATRGSR